MSYCRWSSDDWRSDVYVFADSRGGWTTHVASRRHNLAGVDFPPPVRISPDSTEAERKAWIARHRLVESMVERATLEPIGGPADGEEFNDPTPGACADRLLTLRGQGYWVPQYAVDALRAEQLELVGSGSGED